MLYVPFVRTFFACNDGFFPFGLLILRLVGMSLQLVINSQEFHCGRLSH
jgi:hypothetical protein